MSICRLATWSTGREPGGPVVPGQCVYLDQPARRIRTYPKCSRRLFGDSLHPPECDGAWLFAPIDPGSWLPERSFLRIHGQKERKQNSPDVGDIRGVLAHRCGPAEAGEVTRVPSRPAGSEVGCVSGGRGPGLRFPWFAEPCTRTAGCLSCASPGCDATRQRPRGGQRG